MMDSQLYGLWITILCLSFFSEINAQEMWYEMFGNETIKIKLPWCRQNPKFGIRFHIRGKYARIFELITRDHVYFKLQRELSSFTLKQTNENKTPIVQSSNVVNVQFSLQTKTPLTSTGDINVPYQIEFGRKFTHVIIGGDLNQTKNITGYIAYLKYCNKRLEIKGAKSYRETRFSLNYPKCINSNFTLKGFISGDCRCIKGYKKKNFSHCIPNYCETNICKHSGTCLKESNGNKFCTCINDYYGYLCGCYSNYCNNKGICKEPKSDNISCQCNNGYFGKTCLCTNNYCKNDGKCKQNSLDGPRCTCTSDYFGKYCLCKRDYCVHGSCNDTNGSSKCICKEGYFSKRCLCHNNYCKNNGVCIEKSGERKCRCKYKFSGETCQCTKDYCGRRGKCYETDGSIKCKCKSKYYGDRCLCYKNYCYNKGVCNVKNASAQCTCTKEYVGKYCGCSKEFCKNDGTCIKYQTCKCPKNFYGKTCSCYKGYCQNNGDCINRNTKTFCKCKNGYYGKYCQCAPNFCKNKGTCIENNRRPICKCVNGYQSHDCSCLPNFCNYRGTCSLKNKKHKCTCNARYMGDRCGCLKTECLNGGQCFYNETRESSYCSCPHHYFHKTCVCHSSYCQNGLCTPNPKNSTIHVCKCTRNYYGEKCDKKVSFLKLATPYIIIGTIFLVLLVLIFIFVKVISRCVATNKNFETSSTKEPPAEREMKELFTQISKNTKPSILEKLKIDPKKYDHDVSFSDKSSNSSLSLVNLVLPDTPKIPLKPSIVTTQSQTQNKSTRRITFAKGTNDNIKVKTEGKEEPKKKKNPKKPQ